jgi:hypothetical protein
VSAEWRCARQRAAEVTSRDVWMLTIYSMHITANMRDYHVPVCYIATTLLGSDTSRGGLDGPVRRAGGLCR